jgi:hypothetical protein
LSARSGFPEATRLQSGCSRDTMCGHMSTHHDGGLSVFIAHQVWTGIPPKVRKLASHIILYPQRIAKDSVGHIARMPKNSNDLLVEHAAPYAMCVRRWRQSEEVAAAERGGGGGGKAKGLSQWWLRGEWDFRYKTHPNLSWHTSFRQPLLIVEATNSSENPRHHHNHRRRNRRQRKMDRPFDPSNQANQAGDHRTLNREVRPLPLPP